MRGAVAQDLHGAFAEWEAQAHGLTRCKNYLFSLSINPDELQGRIDREAYFDYIARVETKNGITDQPRAVVFHIKDGREHCHVVWSRIDTEAGKAINLPFYKDKLMTVSREFARDHGIELPQGYYAHEDRQWRRNRQLSRYDAIKQKERRADLAGKIAMHETAQAARRQMLDADQLAARRKLRVDLVAELRERRIDRARNRPHGLAAFLGKVTGISLAIKKLHEYRDRQRIKTYRAERDALTHQQAEQLAEFDERQKLQAADLKRQQRALDQIEKKELASVQQALRKEHRQAHHKQHVHSPSFALTLGPPGRAEAIDKAATRYTSETRRALEADEKEIPNKEKVRRINLIDAFTRAADSDDDDDGGGGGDDGGKSPGPPNKPGPDRPKRRRKRDRDMGRGM